MRLANVALASVLLGAALALAHPGLRRALALSWIALLIPLGIFMIASTNPSGWTITGLGTYWALLATLFRSRPGRMMWVTGAFCALAAVITLGSRSDGAAFLVLVTVAVAILTVDHRNLSVMQVVLPMVAIALALYVFATAGQSHSISGFGVGYDVASRQGLPLAVGNILGLPVLFFGMFGIGFGGLGWFDTQMHPVVGVLTWGTACACLVLAIGNFWTRKAVAVLMVASALVVIPLYVLQGGGNVVGENVQPRYLLPLALCGLGLALYTPEDAESDVRSWRIATGALVFITAAVSFAHMIALQTELRRYTVGLDNSSLDLNAVREWWWSSSVTPMTSWFLGTFFGAALFAGLAWASRVTDGAKIVR